jgi:hypothetical protein
VVGRKEASSVAVTSPTVSREVMMNTAAGGQVGRREERARCDAAGNCGQQLPHKRDSLVNKATAAAGGRLGCLPMSMGSTSGP